MRQVAACLLCAWEDTTNRAAMAAKIVTMYVFMADVPSVQSVDVV